MSTVIVIPARFGSKRLPGKPLIPIAGKTLLQRVYEVALQVKVPDSPIEVMIATDDERIRQHALDLGAKVVMTPTECPTGTDRTLACVQQLSVRPDIIINLQGDAPFTPPHFLSSLIQTMQGHPSADLATPFVQLTWEELDRFRKSKLMTPFSGTTVAVDNNGYALWFSKLIFPSIRDEDQYRERHPLSPIRKHIGVYGYRYHALEKFVALPEGYYEKLEGLEQLRCLENGMRIKMIQVDYQGAKALSGIDSPEDVIRAEALLKESIIT